MEIANRIEQAPACQVIKLTEAEKDVYRGAGWKLARFVDGALVGFFDPMEVQNPDDEALATVAVREAILWLEEVALTTDEVWLVMCSGFQLCEPRRITLLDASAVASMARVFAKQVEDFE